MSHSSINFEQLFQHLPECYIIFEANHPRYTFVEVSDAHRELTGKERSELIGHDFFTVFPDTSDAFKNTGKSELLDVFQSIIKYKKPVSLKAFRYDIPDTSGAYVERYWEPVHYPITNEKGEVTHILQISRNVTDEISTDKKLAETEQLLERALTAASLGIWNWDIQNDIITGDKNLAKLFNVDPSLAAAGLPLTVFTDSIHPDDQSTVVAEITKTIKNRGSFEQDYRTVHSDGTYSWVSARGNVEVDDKGEPSQFPGIIIDISARKKAEDDVKQSAQRFIALADSMPQLVWVTRPDGYHEYYNKAWYDYTGTTYEQVKGAGWNEAFHPDDRVNAATLWQKSLKTGQPYEVDYRLRYKDGTYRWFVGRALPYKNEAGEIEKWYGTCTYIDSQKRATEREAFLSETSKILTSSLDYKKTFVLIAKTITRDVADWCSIELLNTNGVLESVALTHRDSSKVIMAKRFREVQAINEKQYTTNSLLAVKDGNSLLMETIPEELIVASVTNPEALEIITELGLCSSIQVPIIKNKTVIGIMTLASAEQKRSFDSNDLRLAEELGSRMSLMLTNATLYKEAQDELVARRKLEAQLVEINTTLENKVQIRTQQLQDTNKELSRSNQELQDFAYVASHDLQEPLRKIQAFGDMLASEYQQEIGEGADYLERMQSAAARMSILISDLLSFSRVATKAKPFVQIDLNMILEDVTDDLYSRIQDTKGTISVANLPTILGDEVQMRQLFQNLLSNALKFHNPEIAPVITITVKKLKHHYAISVKDNGIGFDEKYTDKIFAVFQRLHGRNEYEGTGIGLAVCRKIVERHNGIIDVKSKPGNGAEFIIKLPILQGEQSS